MTKDLKNVSKPLVVDLTHGGVTIARELKKIADHVLAWDIYGTLKGSDHEMLLEMGIDEVDGPVTGSTVIAPVHCPVKADITHHEITGLLLGPWKEARGIPVVEVTGVKGKTSAVWILRKIMENLNPLILSSLGSYAGSELLRRDISITPASMIETVKLAGPRDYGSAIFEVSLGGTGLADVGVLTNIAEDYTIRRGTSRASSAKRQIFKSRMVCCDLQAFNRYYRNFGDKTNTFSVDAGASVHATDIRYGLDSTVASVSVEDLKTIDGDRINTEFGIETFAPAEHHLSNVLAAVSAALTLNLDVRDIRRRVKGFQGIPGRTSIRKLDGSSIIEEVNPGLNVKAVEYTLKMAEDLPDPAVIIGGRYGVTCEDIDEDRLSGVLREFSDLNIMFTDELGYSIMRKTRKNSPYFKSPDDALKAALEHETVILIYRSEYRDLSRR
ncbi:coenzyme F430 synthase [Methanothermobacter marburgensis]|uniref:Predicted UDP-N-acetylmuramyl pentapeptide synthase n=1 Tax=Methanothermobacter marburgensis (strain ATCC BAA-927 / DSM 2133 / JCM 14651 / NBRC 100331 / OCM 82 / Marburg) TaxID=79929 RepID=D9PXA8_METTM|nr:coenzyme F430 synthase [Methanothermobacter marburgensis]ADL58856.1 predicted UDP-N-acetylmuramyl pentapeptide synthase [Methanothermobacter marburgensis str. Marburg]WBF09403.1 coenzyme F430 synthase [Methanothermobacter marburgensis]